MNFPNEKREVAHVIISALSEHSVQNRRVPVLIACNKQGTVYESSWLNILCAR